MNYNIAAGEDDGTCVYCQTSATLEDSSYETLGDYNFDSGNNPYYQSQIIMLDFTSSLYNFNSKQCGFPYCGISLIVHNVVDKTVIFNAEFINLSDKKDTIIYNITIPPYKYSNVGLIFKTSTSSGFTIPFINIILHGNFSYH